MYMSCMETLRISRPSDIQRAFMRDSSGARYGSSAWRGGLSAFHRFRGPSAEFYSPYLKLKVSLIKHLKYSKWRLYSEVFVRVKGEKGQPLWGIKKDEARYYV